jgi:type I restriction enzyme M protein
MRIEEFAPEKAWWTNRTENEHAWKVKVEDIIASNYNLDIKNPNTIENDHGDPQELLEKYQILLSEIEETRTALKKELMNALAGKNA